MAIRALDPMVPFWHTPAGQGDDPKPTRFRLRGLDGGQFSEVLMEARFDDAGKFLGDSARSLELSLKYGLLGWENFCNAEGEVPFASDNFRLIDFSTRMAISAEIWKASKVSEAERKNS